MFVFDDLRPLPQPLYPLRVQLALLLPDQAVAHGLAFVRVELRRIRPLPRLQPEDVPGVAFLHGRLRNRARPGEREHGRRELRRLPDAGDVAAHRMEGLRFRGLRRGECAEVELAWLRLLHRIEVLQVLAGAQLRERVLGLLLRHLLRLLRLHQVGRDLLAHLVERLQPRGPLFFRLEDVEAGSVLEHVADLAWFQPDRLILQRLSVRRLPAGEEPEVAAGRFRRLVIAAPSCCAVYAAFTSSSETFAPAIAAWTTLPRKRSRR